MNSDPPSPEKLRAMGPASAATLWLERLQREVSAQDAAAFEAWRQASQDNARAWERACDLWDVFEEPDTEGVLEGLRREALSLRGQSAKPVMDWRLAAAAVVALVIGGVLFSGRLPQGPRQVASAQAPDLRAFGKADYQTAAGQRLEVKLKDGTRLQLGPSTAIDVAYGDGLRLARLTQGEVTFDVTHDADHPFRVAAGERIISDLGTRFSIRLNGGETRVRLDEGSLGVTVGDDPHRVAGMPKILVPGQELVARAGRVDDLVAVLSAPQAQREIIQFDNVTLAEAVAEMNRHAKAQLVVTDPKVAAMRISGAFQAGDSVAFAETLTALYPVRVIRLPDGHIGIAAARP